MATKFSIGVIITARDQASAVIGRVGRSAKLLSDPIGKIGGSLLKVGGYATAAATALTAVGGKLLGDFLERTGEIKDFSNQIGWSAEALQSWRYASKLAGVANEEFGTSVQVMTHNLGQAKSNTGPLFAMLSKVAPGVLAQIKAARPEEAFDVLVRAMEKIPDATKRAAFAQAAFGRGGAVMARLAVEGSKSLAEYRKEAERLGIVMSQEDVDAAEAFGDNIDRLKSSLMGVGNTIFSRLVPGLDKGARGITGWIAKNRELIATRVVSFIESLGEKLAKVGAWFDSHADSIQNVLTRGLEAADKTLGFMVTHIDALTVAATTFGTIWLTGKVASGLSSAIKLSKELAGIWAGMGASKAAGGMGGSPVVVPTGSPAGGEGIWGKVGKGLSFLSYLVAVPVAELAVTRAWKNQDKWNRDKLDETIKGRTGEGRIFRSQTDLAAWQSSLFSGSPIPATEHRTHVVVELDAHKVPDIRPRVKVVEGADRTTTRTRYGVRRLGGE